MKSDKGNFIVDEESLKLMKKEFSDKGIDIVVDYEHQTLNDVQAPAGGWIKDFYIKDNSIVAKVEWTEKAKQYIKNKEYRYLSPVVLVRKNDNKAVLLHSVALTNTPAIRNMSPIINKLNVKGEKNKMTLQQMLINLLGLAENATEDEVIKKLEEFITENQETLTNKEKTTITQQNTTTNVNKTTADNLKDSSISTIFNELIELKANIAKKEANALVTEAISLGKISPAQKEWAEAYALKNPEEFKQYIKVASVVVPMGEINVNKAENKNKDSIDETTLAVCKSMGLTKEDIIKYRKEAE